MKLPSEPNAARSFRNLGIGILLAGGGIAFFYWKHRVDPEAQDHFRMSFLLTLLASGICFIVAAAKWFMKR